MGVATRADQIDALLFNLLHPLFWPRWTRRLFVVALPITIVLWSALLAAALLGRISLALLKPIVRFWTEPTLHRVRFGYYGYDRKHQRREPFSRVRAEYSSPTRN